MPRLVAVRKLSFLVAAVLIGSSAAAQNLDQQAARANLPPGVTALGPVTTPNWERYRFESENVGKSFVIEVVRVDSPLPAPSPSARLPIVFVTDNDQFSTLVPAIARSLPLFQSMFVVGIGYDRSSAASFAESVLETGTRRATDFTPTFDEAYIASAKRMGLPWPDDLELGGAGAFLAFINDELKPFVAARYPANTEDATLIGHSLGGLFALHVLFTSPKSFTRYIAISPAADYDDEILLREEAALGDVRARLFIGVGGNDLPAILQSAPRLDAQIRSRERPSLRYDYRAFAGETHSSVVPGAITSGLLAVFDAPPLPAFAPGPPNR